MGPDNRPPARITSAAYKGNETPEMADQYYDMDANPVMPQVSFGPKDHQKITLVWAETGLTWLYEHRRDVFGAMMLGIVEAEKERAPRAPKAGQ